MRIFVIEDERALAEAITRGLRRAGHGVDVAYDGASALAWLEDNDVDVVVLDRDLPILHGDTVCRTLVAEEHAARILMLTAASSLQDLVEGLGLGADDYLAKPFAYLELIARVEALGRRKRDQFDQPVTTILERHGVRLDLRRQVAECDGWPIALTPKEFGVLRELLAADGAFRTATCLLDAVWDDPFNRTTDVVKVAIHRLRGKLGNRQLIENVSGYGYRIP